MPHVDYEAVVLDLKAHISTKASHGRKELLERLNEFEVNRRLPEGEEMFDARPPATRNGRPSSPVPA